MSIIYNIVSSMLLDIFPLQGQLNNHGYVFEYIVQWKNI